MNDLLKFLKYLVTAVIACTALAVFALTGAIGGCRMAGRVQQVRAAPPPDVTTIEAFRDKMDDGQYGWGRFKKDEEYHYEAWKKMPFFCTFPSGPACYVFNDTGQYVDWTPDNGDDPPWDREWGQTGRVEMSYEEIMAEIKARRE